MRKIIASINTTIDGYCQHTDMIPDEEIHQHYTEMLRSAGAIVYGRITYQLMESYWPAIVITPTGKKSMDDFAVAIDTVPKIVFSRTLQNVEWQNTRLATQNIAQEIAELKQQSGKDVFVGSPGVIAALTELNLIDEYQLCVHPVIAGSGLPLFKNISHRLVLAHVKTKTFGSGAMVLYYRPVAGSS